jgi:hypothetical protein
MTPWRDVCASPLRLLLRESVWDELRLNLYEGSDELSPYLMFHSSAVVLGARRRSYVTISRTFAIVSAFGDVEGCLKITPALKSLKRLKCNSDRPVWSYGHHEA